MDFGNLLNNDAGYFYSSLRCLILFCSWVVLFITLISFMDQRPIPRQKGVVVLI